MTAIIRKELADYFNSIRFFILFLLVLASGGLGLYVVFQGLRATLEANRAVTGGGFVFLTLFTSLFGDIPAFLFLLSLIVPIIGIALGFDAINSERTGRTMSRVLAQPVYRDSVINGKFIAGIVTMALMIGATLVLMGGYGLRMIGVPPTAEEIIRLFLYLVITVVYGAFWMGLSMLCSVLFRRVAGSLLVPIVVFLLLFVFWIMLGLGPVIANAVSPIDPGMNVDAQLKAAGTQQTILRLSPSYIYQETFFVLLLPVWKGLGAITTEQASFMVPNPLSLGQSLLAVWPHIVGIISLSAVLFAASYVAFMKQEIRAT